MAQTLNVTTTDDIDGTEDARTVQFGYEARFYEIDLSEDNVAAFEAAIEPYVNAGRKIKVDDLKRSRRGGSAGRAANAEHTTAVREWARENGYGVAERGRISADVYAAYDEAQAAPKSRSRKSRSKTKADAKADTDAN